MLTVSIVVHKTPEHQLRKALECLNISDLYKIYVIDNSPTDDLRSVCTSDKIEYLHVENKGFGAGHNIAIKKSIDLGSHYHLVMNADVWWEGDVLKDLSLYLDKNPDVGLVAPKVFYPDGELQYTCRMLPTPSDLIFKRFLPEKVNKKRMMNYLLERHDHDFALNSPYLLGSFLLFRTEALKREGIFDERYFMYPEDIDITRRLHRNWKTIYWPGVSIVHEHQAASRKNRKMLKIHIINMVKYFNKWGWWKDKERENFNKILLDSIVKLSPGKIQKGRG